MAGRTITFKKTLTAGDRNDRFSVPARWRDLLLPQVADNGKAIVRVLDERGDWYEFIMKVRKNKTKPEFMAKAWQRFVRKRKLFPEDIIVFSRGEIPDTFRVEVQEVGPTLTLATL